MDKNAHDQLQQAARDIRALADETKSPLLDMIAHLLEFADTDRPLFHWRAAERALATFKRNFHA